MTRSSKKIAVDHAAVDRMLVAVFLQAHATPPTELALDLDVTDDPVQVRVPWTKSGFCRDALMTWAGAHGVDCVFGLAKNARLTALIPDELAADGKSNPRFVVTSLPLTTADARTLYEEVYCARGEMANRIWLTLLKIGARIRITVRHVWLALATGCPSAALFARVHATLRPC